MPTISYPLFSTLSIASISHTMSVHSTMFPVYQPFELERVMPVSSRLKTRSSNKTVLPLGGDSTLVVHAREPALPHITQTLADFTPYCDGQRTSFTQSNPQPQQIVTQFPLTQHRLHHRAPKHEQLVRQLQCPNHEDHHSEPKVNA